LATITANGVRLDYEVMGTGPPLLLLMGLGAGRRAWVAQAPALSRRLTLYLLDQRGVGGSDKPPGPYHVRQLAEDADAFLDALGVESAHVLGFSLGGVVAQELALLHPARVRSLLLCGAFAGQSRAVRERVMRLARFVGARDPQEILPAARNLDARVEPRRVLELLVPLLFAPAFWEQAPRGVREALRAAFVDGFSLEGFAAQLGAVLEHDALERLGGLRSPTLVIHGDQDRLVPLSEGERLAASIPGAQLLRFPGGTHGFFADQAEAFNQAVLDWVGQIEEERAEGTAEPLEAVEVPIDGVLDLHTFHPGEVQDLVDEYVRECRERGVLEIRVIHGKGRGILRRTVHAALERNPAVLEFHLCEPHAGGWGATRVVLRPREAE
jgi:pimeloyl-ACP methyl ester carboxylesterase